MTAQIDIAYPPDEPAVYVLSTQEYADAIEHTLAELGYTRDQLRDMAATRDFPEPAAFMAYQMIKDDAGTA